MFNFYILKQRLTSLSLALLICAVNVGMATPTSAYYSDRETSLENRFTATTLDFTLGGEVTNYGGLTPNNNTGALPITIATTSDSLPFDYAVQIENIIGNQTFCSALTLSGSLESVVVAEAPLPTFAITSSSSFPQGGDNWSFVVLLGSVPSTLSGATCSFDVVYDGWQVGFSEAVAYHDTEKVTFTITAGSWLETPDESEAVLDIAAIRDSSIDESKPDTNSNATNGGNSQVLELRRASGNDSEAFIGFDYNLPTGSVVTGAELKAYLYQTPTPNTIYTASRVTSAWTESGVTWNGQPTSVVSDTTSTGDGSAKWLTWDVTSDVQGVVNGSFDNHGWNLSDTDPLPVSGARTGKFRSSEHESSSDVRPVLEVTFDAPTATTDHLVINEVFFDVDSGNGSDANNEWIELYNPTASPISIENWDICDNTSCDNVATTTAIPAYGFAVITNNTSTFDLHWTDIPAGAVKIALGGSLGNGLAALGDRIILKNASDVIVDQVNYGTDTAVFNPGVGITGEDGKSIARVVKGWDTDSRDDWILNATPNPGTNPGSDQIEIMRFTEGGVEVAAISVGLEELPELTTSEIAALLALEVAETEIELASLEVSSTEEVIETPQEVVEPVALVPAADGEEIASTTAPSLEPTLEEVPELTIEAREEDILMPEVTEPLPEQVEEEIVLPEEEEVLEEESEVTTEPII